MYIREERYRRTSYSERSLPFHFSSYSYAFRSSVTFLTGNRPESVWVSKTVISCSALRGVCYSTSIPQSILSVNRVYLWLPQFSVDLYLLSISAYR